jgi:uncharacterized Zn finger protein (UPF0148 family)
MGTVPSETCPFCRKPVTFPVVDATGCLMCPACAVDRAIKPPPMTTPPTKAEQELRELAESVYDKLSEIPLTAPVEMEVEIILSALKSVAREPGRLEWTRRDGGIEANTPVGDYMISALGDGFFAELMSAKDMGRIGDTFSSEVDAQQACQDHFNSLALAVCPRIGAPTQGASNE